MPTGQGAQLWGPATLSRGWPCPTGRGLTWAAMLGMGLHVGHTVAGTGHTIEAEGTSVPACSAGRALTRLSPTPGWHESLCLPRCTPATYAYEMPRTGKPQRQETSQRVTQASMVGRPRRAGHPGLLCGEYTLEEAGGKPGQALLGCHCPTSLSANRNQWFPEASFFRGFLIIIVPSCVSKRRPASAGFWVVSWAHPWGPCGSGDRLPLPSQSSLAQQWCPLHALPSILQTMLCW